MKKIYKKYISHKCNRIILKLLNVLRFDQAVYLRGRGRGFLFLFWNHRLARRAPSR
jgi:hypothetical protein